MTSDDCPVGQSDFCANMELQLLLRWLDAIGIATVAFTLISLAAANWWSLAGFGFGLPLYV